MQRSTIAIIADVALVETQRKRSVCRVLKRSNSFAPADRVTAESDYQRLTCSAELSCDYKKKTALCVSDRNFQLFAAFFVKRCLFRAPKA